MVGWMHEWMVGFGSEDTKTKQLIGKGWEKVWNAGSYIYTNRNFTKSYQENKNWAKE